MMPKRRPDAFSELLRSTGTEWEEVPEGFELTVIDDSDADNPRVVIPLPRDVARVLKHKTLQARISRGNLVLRGRRYRRPAKRSGVSERKS